MITDASGTHIEQGAEATDLAPVSLAAPARPDDMVLPGTAERIARGVPKNTSRSYERAWRGFVTWCQANRHDHLPASPTTLADFAAHLCDLGRSPATIKHDLAVVSKHHQMAGFPKGAPNVTAANLVLRGYRADRAEEGQREKEAPPITRDRLRQMSAACDPATLAGKRDRLLLVIGWALAGRRSELAALRIEDITVGAHELDALIRSSKTDKDSAGELVNIPAGEHVDTDPVGLLIAWLAALAERGEDAASGRLFRAVTQHDRLYRHAALRAAGIHEVVRRAAQRAGLPNAHLYSGHSLRAGFATQAANDGIPQSIWAEHGRWEKTSPVPAKYVRRADRKRDNPLRKMGL